MNFSRLPQQFIGTLFFFFTLISCDSDFHAVGVEIFSEMSFETKETKIPVYRYLLAGFRMSSSYSATNLDSAGSI